MLNPFLLGLYVWEESTLMQITLKRMTENSREDHKDLNLKGDLHISVIELLRTVISMKGYSKGKFICLLFQSFLRTYILQIPRGSYKAFINSEGCQRPYPSNNLLQIKTGK